VTKVVGVFVRFRAPTFSIIIKSKYNSQLQLVELRFEDVINGNENWRGDEGYQDQDFEAVIDFTRGSRYFFISANFFTRFSLLDFDASICSGLYWLII
jgi:hypothetical protein